MFLSCYDVLHRFYGSEVHTFARKQHLAPLSGISQLSSSAQTLASGFLAVISVNIVIGFYIYSAMKEAPRQEPQPDAPSQRMLKQVLTSQHLLK